jgi:predicted AAA+ superfamily ATPase
VFVFAWRCSKHAAYYCVKANSQKEVLVMARGVGTSSLVSAAVEFVNENAGGFP